MTSGANVAHALPVSGMKATYAGRKGGGEEELPVVPHVPSVPENTRVIRSRWRIDPGTNAIARLVQFPGNNGNTGTPPSRLGFHV